MTYEPKVGDDVVIRGEVTRVEPTRTGSMWTTVRVHPGATHWNFPADALVLADDLGEAELRGQVTGPWAVALSEAMEKIEARLDALETVPSWAIDIGERLDALEASAKVRDVPATMVNLAHRVQTLECAHKTLMDTMREREDATRAELDGALLRVGRLEEFAKPRASFVEKFPVADARPVAQDFSAPFMPWPTELFSTAGEVRDAQGRVLKSKRQDTDPQGDWSTSIDKIAHRVQGLEVTSRTLVEDVRDLKNALGALSVLLDGFSND